MNDAAAHPTIKASSSSSNTNLYDDESAADHDPMLLDMLGFTSVSQYLQYKVHQALKQAKVECCAAALWGSLSLAMLLPLGGPTAYHEMMRSLDKDSLLFVWVYLLGYYTVKGAVMSVATGWREWSDRSAEEQQMADIAQLESQLQRRAYWQVQERRARWENRANRTYTEFSLASLLLGVLILSSGGPDKLQLQLDALDQDTMSTLLIMLFLFWESYFAGIGAFVQLVQLATAFISKWQHTAKWEKKQGQ
eukprot:gene13704-13826_t